MGERRQATRREPIEVEVADGRVFTAIPLPWMQANDLGNEILRQNQEGTNEFIRMYVNDDGLPQLEMKLKQKIMDWASVLKLAFPSVEDSYWHEPTDLDADQCAQLVLASLDVNHLEHIKHLVDPNSPTPTLPGGMDSSVPGTIQDGPKTVSTVSSDSQVSPEMEPSTSLAEK